MAKITVLDQHTINQIAAGEVIERPASVVKELLENAIDAQATAITVEIKGGGIDLIRITDNGCGITKEEVPLAFCPHATSKIQTAEDLALVSSLGFRGEALASIASVAQVEIITKTAGNMVGTRYIIEGGQEKSFEEIGAPEGTTFLVRNLFFNTPARRKFLKSPTSEGTHIGELVERIALSHPDISIRFINNNQNKLHTAGNHNLKDMIYTIYGRDIASNLLKVEAEHETIKISGYIGKPVIARGNRNYENYYINGRYVKSGLIYKAIEEAFSSYMMLHKYPFTVLYIQINPDLMDVNVHPTKMELRFRESEQIFQVIMSAVKEALAQKELIPEVTLIDKKEQKIDQILKSSIPEPFEKNRLEQIADRHPHQLLRETSPYSFEVSEPKVVSPAKVLTSSHDDRSLNSLIASEEDITPIQKQIRPGTSQKFQLKEEMTPPVSSPEQLGLFEGKLFTKEARSDHRLIGQVFGTYWMVQYKEHLFMIDQHAAHEKVLYEKTMKAMKERMYTSQQISPPIILTLSMKEEELLQQYMHYFTDIGFEIEAFGGKEYAVRAIPDNLFGIAKQELLMELLDGLSEDLGKNSSHLIQERIASLSCKAAVKGNHRFSEQEAEQLIDQLLDLENPYTCPHGRPTIVTMSKYELEKKFKRIL